MSEPGLYTYLFFIAGLLVLSAFFSASETVFISLGRHHFQKIAERDAIKSGRLKFWFDDPGNVLVTALVGNNIVNILAAVLAARLSFTFFPFLGSAAITGVMTFLILVYAEIIPKSLARKNAETLSLYLALPIRFFCIILRPVIKVLIFCASLTAKIFGGNIDAIIPVVTEEDLKAMIVAGEEGGVIEEDEKDMIDSIFELGDKMVKEIMTPRVNIVAFPETAPFKSILDTVVREGFSRMPVYKENIDKITGIVYLKDVVAKGGVDLSKSLDLVAMDFMREVYFVPETKKVNDLMSELQDKKMQMAVVVDEYGGTAGLVTMEDLVEEIVGEISDEYKKDAKELHMQPDGSYIVHGGMEIEKVNEELAMDIPEGRFETIAGFVLDHLGKFPFKGESFYYEGREFFIQEADNKKIRLIKITTIEKGDEDE